MTLPKAILFDLDDTIVSFNNASSTAWKKSCENFVSTENVPFNSESLLQKINEIRTWYWSDPVRHKTGRENMKNARREIVEYTFKELDYFNIDNSIKLADNYTKLQDELICLFDGVFETLEKLYNLNVRMAIITNGTSKGQRNKLERFNLNKFFELVLIDTEVGFSKPDTKIYEIALEKLSLTPNEVWMVGDNLVWDIEAPQKLGIYSVWNDYNQEGLPSDSNVIPNKTINSISDLIEEFSLIS